ncbi:putative sugar kinase YoaC [Adhaeribacter aerolatus]|uniref:Putative sugar kinase YoaC n=1 Tax=Adhaeribacter aerolatus TaxID=670289 RepID=A0A512AV16_9BACT|nr:FGGY family carbohydrate kinase [Adhaeribacter aerolatus]GEO03561.1 putative sugar kinase YoaC [Adhaeribacter aerolatus]
MAAKEAYIIIDIGTGNVRVAVAATSGKILSVERANMPYHKDENYPEAIYFNPNELWGIITNLAQTALQQVPGVEIKALTATSQREGIVLIGQNGESLIGLPNIDHRGREWESLMTDKSNIYTLTGRYPTSLFSALKLVGIRERHPEIWEQFATFVSISDWAQYMLSGVARYEHSQASETLLYDVAQKQWSPELCFTFDINPNNLSELGSAGAILGNILPEQASVLNISPAAVIIIGGADTQLAVLGTQPAPDDVVIVSGTTTPIIKLANSYIIDPQERSWTNRHTDVDSFILETNAGVTGLNYQRLKEIFYPNESYAVIEQELAALTQLQCVASLGSLVADEKTPITKGGFIFPAPVSHLLTRAHFVWATLWDIACSIKENYSTLCDIEAHEKDYVWACGGGFQSPLLRQFISNLLQKKVMVRENYQQSSVVGGVIICNEALGVTGQTEVPVTVVEPQVNARDQQLYTEWKKNRATFKQMCLEEVA